MTTLTHSINEFIDHTLLKPQATSDQVRQLCAEAKQHHFASVCINPVFVSQAKGSLEGSTVKVCTVIGFPLGANCTVTKVAETQQAIKDGATEIDMVIAIGQLKSRNLQLVEDDIREVVATANGLTVKVIIETYLLDKQEKILACEIAKRAGAHFVKTSTGFSGGGASVEDIKLMRHTVGPETGVKASGGIRNLSQALELIEAGATRLGTSQGVKLVLGKSEETGEPSTGGDY